MEEGRFAKRLYYSETHEAPPYLTEYASTKISNGELRCSDGNGDGDDNGNIDDDWLDGGSCEDEPSKDRELQKMCDQFHTMGYRDGVIAGKEAAAQEGFNIGFRESVLEGYNWGLVRGITSAVACLPDGLKKRLIATQERRSEFQDLYGSVHSVSTTDALKLFHDDTLNKRGVDQCEQDKASSSTALVHSVHSVSTIDTLKLFNDDILKKREVDQCEQDKASSSTASVHSVHSVPTIDTLKLFHDDILKKRVVDQCEQDKARSSTTGLYGLVHCVSTTDALKLFHEEILNKKEEDRCEQDKANSNTAALLEENSSCSHLGKYVGKLQSLLVECPAIQSHLALN